MFNKKSKQIQKLNNLIKESTQKEKEYINDFILILNQIQELSNTNTQWKRKKVQIDNAIDLAKENYTKKIVELDIDPQY